MTPRRRLLFAVAVLIPGTSDAQDAAAPAKERERISFVYFAPDRLGLLIPLDDRRVLATGAATETTQLDQKMSEATNPMAPTMTRMIPATWRSMPFSTSRVPNDLWSAMTSRSGRAAPFIFSDAT